MAKTKYIVPVVAMMLCVVSLIGAGYAAYTATLTDNESATVENKYIELEMGATPVAQNIKLEWNYAATYTNGASGQKLWTLVDGQKAQLMSFSISKTNTSTGTSTNYALALSNVALNGTPTITGGTVKIFSDSNLTTEVSGEGLAQMAYGTTYYAAFCYTQAGDPITSTTAPGDHTLNYVLTATANNPA